MKSEFRPYPSTQIAKEALHPHTKTLLVNLDGVPVLRHINIPLFPDTSHMLYGEKITGHIDYVSLCLSDFTKNATADKPTLRMRYDIAHPDGKNDFQAFAKRQMDDTKRHTSNFQIMAGRILRKESKSTVKGYPLTRQSRSSEQCAAVMELLHSVFWLPKFSQFDVDMLVDFFKSIRAHPEKPILFVDGHGMTNLSGVWVAGEREGRIAIPVDELLSYIEKTTGKNHYSAIVLNVCNEGNLRPKKLGKTSIFYVCGNAGGNEKKVRRTVKKV